MVACDQVQLQITQAELCVHLVVCSWPLRHMSIAKEKGLPVRFTLTLKQFLFSKKCSVG